MSSKPLKIDLKLIVNQQLEKEGEIETVLSQYEVDALLRAISSDPCHLTLVYSDGPNTHISKRLKRRVFMNLVNTHDLCVKSFEQYEYIMNRPSQSLNDFADFVIHKLGRRK